MTVPEATVHENQGPPRRKHHVGFSRQGLYVFGRNFAHWQTLCGSVRKLSGPSRPWWTNIYKAEAISDMRT